MLFNFQQKSDHGTKEGLNLNCLLLGGKPIKLIQFGILKCFSVEPYTGTLESSNLIERHFLRGFTTVSAFNEYIVHVHVTFIIYIPDAQQGNDLCIFALFFPCIDRFFFGPTPHVIVSTTCCLVSQVYELHMSFSC